jgi:hypothetical protein
MNEKEKIQTRKRKLNGPAQAGLLQGGVLFPHR